jgi:hypothetical protein
MTVYIVARVNRMTSPYADCRCLGSIEAIEYKGARRVVLTREEAYVLVSKGTDRLWVPAGNGFVPVVPVYWEGMRYVRTEPEDTSDDILVKQGESADDLRA